MPNAAAPEDKPGPPESVGRYEIVEALGSGAMGTVYRARDTVLDREVAVKVMAGGLNADPGFRARFEREARIVARINHPNVVAAYDLGYHTDGAPFIAMELLSGQDLASILRSRRLDPDDCAAVAMQVLAGLARAHQREIVHRDVKPANIFLTNEGKVKVMDFGVARVTASAVTATGAVLGTAHYMSPEQLSGGKVDGRSDLFSVGCVLFEMLAARRPFQGEDMLGILYQIANTEPDYSFVSAEGQELLPILRRSLEKDQARRYQSATDFARDLQHHLAGTATSPWARQAAQVVELEPASGSGPVAEAGTPVDGDAPTAIGEPAPTSGPLTYLYDNAPTAIHQDTASRTRPARPARQERSGGPLVLAGIGVLGVALAGLGWWLGQKQDPVTEQAPVAAAAPVAEARAEVASPPPDITPGAETPPASSRAPAPADPPPSEAPAADTGRAAAALPSKTVRPRAAAVAGPPAEPAPEPPPSRQSPSAPTEAAAPPASATGDIAADPAVPSPAAPAAPPVTTPPVTTPPVTTPPAPPPVTREAAVSAPPPVAPPVTEAAAPEPPAPARSPLTVGTTRGRHFDGRALPQSVALGFRANPDTPRAGGRSTVTVALANNGGSLIQVRQVVVTTTSGGDRRTENESSQTRVAPGQEAPVLFRTVSWPAGPPWSMEVVVHTRSGDTYTNTVSWK